MFLKSVSTISHGTYCPRVVRALAWTRITSATVGCVDGSPTFPGQPSCSVEWGDWSSSPSLDIFCLVFVSTICCSCGYLKTLAVWWSLQETSQIWPTGSHPQAVGPGRKSLSLLRDDVTFCFLSFSDKHVSFSHRGLWSPGCKTISEECRHEWCQLEYGNRQESVPLTELGLQVSWRTNLYSLFYYKNVFLLNKQWKMPESSAATCWPLGLEKVYL